MGTTQCRWHWLGGAGNPAQFMKRLTVEDRHESKEKAVNVMKEKGKPTDLDDLDELERLARAATPGPWREAPEIQGVEPVTPEPSLMAVAYDIQREEGNAYITAVSPAAVLALIAEVRLALTVSKAPGDGATRVHAAPTAMP